MPEEICICVAAALTLHYGIMGLPADRPEAVLYARAFWLTGWKQTSRAYLMIAVSQLLMTGIVLNQADTAQD